MKGQSQKKFKNLKNLKKKKTDSRYPENWPKSLEKVSGSQSKIKI